MSSSRTFVASAASSLRARPGTSSSTPENSRGPSTSTVSGVCAIAVAVRGPLVEQRQLADARPGSDGGDLLAVALDLHFAVDDHEALASALALAHEHPSRGQLGLVGRPSDALQLLVRAGREQRDRCQAIEVLILAGHVPSRTVRAPRRGEIGAERRRSARFTFVKQARNIAAVRVAAWTSSWSAGRLRSPGASNSRDGGVPRLLLVDQGVAPPRSADELEDWIRVPADEVDLHARVENLDRRAKTRTEVKPALDGDGVLRVNGAGSRSRRSRLASRARLLSRYGSVVSRDALASTGWPEGAPGRNALDVHVLRLRRRIAPLGLTIRTVRSRGYLLE